MNHGKRIRQARERLGLTQAELSARSGVGKSEICHIENGREPKLYTILAIAQELDVSVEFLALGQPATR